VQANFFFCFIFNFIEGKLKNKKTLESYFSTFFSKKKVFYERTLLKYIEECDLREFYKKILRTNYYLLIGKKILNAICKERFLIISRKNVLTFFFLDYIIFVRGVRKGGCDAVASFLCSNIIVSFSINESVFSAPTGCSLFAFAKPTLTCSRSYTV